MAVLLSCMAAGLTLAVGRFAWIRCFPRPCPWWLRYLLENPYMEKWTGASALIERIGLGPGMKVLDVGCGPGRLAIPFAKHVGPEGQVVAFDLQERMLDIVRQRVVEHRLANVHLIHGTAGQGSMPWKEFFDRVVLVTVFGEIRNKRQALQAIFGALKSGGILSVTEVLPDPDYQTVGTVLRLCRQAGFHPGSRYGHLIAYTFNFEKPGESGEGDPAAQTGTAAHQAAS